MKVVHIAVSDGGGAGMGMMNQHHALLALGVDSRVVVARKTSSDPTVAEMRPNRNLWGSNRVAGFAQKALRRAGITFNDYDRWHHRIYKSRLRQSVQFSQPYSQYDVLRHPLVADADIVNLHYVSEFVDLPSFFAGVGKPVVWTMRDENPGLGGFHYQSIKQQYYQAFATIEDAFIGVKRAAIGSCRDLHLVSLSDEMRQFCQAVDFLSDKPNAKIYNAISPDDYQPVGKAEARRQLGLAADDVVLAFVSCNLGEERKGFQLVREAIRLLADERIKLLCVGRCDMQIDEANVITLGTVTDRKKLSAVYSAADAFVNASEQESFGKTVVEALYCGTPVVSTPTGIAPEIVDPSNGCLCGGRTPQAIATAIAEVLGSTHDAAAIRRKAVGQFAPEVVANQYIDLYNSIIRR